MCRVAICCDGLFAGINFDTDRRIAEIDLVSTAVPSTDYGMRHLRLTPDRIVIATPCPDGPADDVFTADRARDHISRANHRIRPMMLTSSPLPS
jgi:hypothetical protein